MEKPKRERKSFRQTIERHNDDNDAARVDTLQERVCIYVMRKINHSVNAFKLFSFLFIERTKNLQLRSLFYSMTCECIIYTHRVQFSFDYIGITVRH